ncbi:phosphopantothenoylcysteine decarboxylase/phosphopantothenate--cysteine ligase [Methanohalophilus levihalophilus]|uniref:bifunctional phosphopantothenoylcysteine decarboxylase/phosphopantothenate--cysteine ligase CoaBC n=1 Tax=Methanohalophilus levihalophilus TaxID=1431282 RepID=UPI001AE26A06|nr:bifunctional phosphopantothenoylcysteine decarboxylase/phosphopantothenate--cysteine ligase CoaBC [Methanohalophilus levihalophilus]MBP2030465.1 phosphopantothenoylcysteine decarboxylase/phosphopantothenate--cysteine ligase [Methanohalophilus levihalophilus]
MHSTHWIKGNNGKSLSGKTIVIGVTGSIAAVRIVELARELIRNGADVYAVMSEAATRILHPDALHYATGNPVVTDITGRVEHVSFCGLEGNADLLLIAPATANTIGKIAYGIDDTPVTTFATTAIGSNRPVLVVPAMHQSMYDHPAVTDNLDKLKKYNIGIVGPLIEEGVAKIASNDDIVLAVERTLGGDTLKGKRVLITSGATAETIDPIRILTNRASGKTGMELAREAYRKGADVTIVHRGFLGAEGINEVYVESVAEMLDACMDELRKGYDVFISAAAISDYTLESPSSSKIKSGDELNLKLRSTSKILAAVKSEYPDMLAVGFKAETGVTSEELIAIASFMLESYGLDLVVANDVAEKGMGTDDNSIFLVESNSTSCYSGSKRELATTIIGKIADLIK